MSYLSLEPHWRISSLVRQSKRCRIFESQNSASLSIINIPSYVIVRVNPGGIDQSCEPEAVPQNLECNV